MKKETKKKRVSTSSFGITKERDYFIENLALLLTAGMDILTALTSLKEEMRTPKMKKIIDFLIQEIDAGTSLGNALMKTKLLPLKVVSLIKVGEETGRLAENLKVVVAQQQKERVFKSQVRSAMMYPILILSLMLLIGTGIAWFILPKLATVFTNLDLELPFITRVLIGAGTFLGNYGAIVLPLALIILIVIIYLLFFSARTRFIGQGLLFALPIIRKLIQEIELARLGFILGTLLESGLPVVDALASLQQTTSFRSYQRLYTHLQHNIEEGNSFQKSFSAYPRANRLIPRSIQHMIVAGEQSGHLSEILLKIGDTFDKKTEISTKNLTVILEPLMLLIVWLGVVGVALAVILPIYSLIGGFHA